MLTFLAYIKFYLLKFESYSMSESQIREGIHECIRQYQLTSRSRSLKRLNVTNETLIANHVLSNEREKFWELYGKKEYYNTKILKLLNGALKDSGTPLEDNSSLLDIDARYINNRSLAKEYVQQRIMPDKTKNAEIRALITKHFALQKAYMGKRRSLEERLQALDTDISEPSSKISIINAQSKKRKITNEKIILKKEIEELDINMIADMKRYVDETERIFKDLEVPFFCIDERYTYENLEIDKKYLLDLLVSLTN